MLGNIRQEHQRNALFDECKECNSEFRIEVCGTLHLFSPHHKVNSEGNTCEFKPAGFRAKKLSLIIFHPKKLSGITVRVENVFGTKQAKRPTTHKSRSNINRVTIVRIE